jgi:uncharacterized membrane protein
MLPALVPPTLPFGVRVPPERVDDPRIARLTRQYRIMIAVGIVVIGLGTIALTRLIDSPLMQAAAWLLVVALMLAAYYRAHRALAAIKAREDWYAGYRQAVVADTTLAPERLRPPVSWLGPALVVIVATVVIGVARYPALPSELAIHFDASGTPDRWVATTPFSAFSLVAMQIVLTVLMVGLVWFVSRGRQELNPSLPETSSEQSRLFVQRMGRGLYMLAAFTNLSMLFGSLQLWGLLPSNGLTILLVTAPVMLGVLGLVALSIRTGQGGSRIPTGRVETPTGFVNRDDDRFWRGGMVYYNPDDPALMVPKRFGVGWTINFARPAAWIFIAAIVALTALPALLSRLGG